MTLSSKIIVCAFLMTLFIYTSKSAVVTESNKELGTALIGSYIGGEVAGDKHDHHFDQSSSVFDRMAEFIENMNKNDGSSRQKRSVSRARYPKWFKQTCRKHFCGKYSCNSFIHRKGRAVCKQCRIGVCRKGMRFLRYSR